MVFRLVSATPSPFARINRIAMLEKGIPFELQTEIPWHKSETVTPKYNPLEKLPILFDPEDSTFEPVYDSAHIQEYIIQKFASQGPKLLTGDLDLDLKARQIQVLAEGVMDAGVLEFFEVARPEGSRSKEWVERQARKVDGGFRAFDQMVREKKGQWLVGDGKVMTIADIAVVCAVGFLDFQGARKEWRGQYPELVKWFEGIDERESFASTRPVMFDIQLKSVI
ncbi:hypothetical protein LTR86_001240 [Recurvomyces mirabilis]|nr:hypothetical protein LTR86_001240 [Recurvomyces mirabilis]